MRPRRRHLFEHTRCCAAYLCSIAPLAKEVQHSLNAVGIGRNDRVGLVLPNSAEMAASFVTVAACCTSAPLNPSYRADEFEFYLHDLNAKALVVEAGSSSASIEVARKLGVSILVLHPTPAKGAGSFTLDTTSRTGAAAAQPGPAQADDVALVLHTSGTTSRPKIVPLTQRFKRPVPFGFLTVLESSFLMNIT